MWICFLDLSSVLNPSALQGRELGPSEELWTCRGGSDLSQNIVPVGAASVDGMLLIDVHASQVSLALVDALLWFRVASLRRRSVGEDLVRLL